MSDTSMCISISYLLQKVTHILFEYCMDRQVPKGSNTPRMSGRIWDFPIQSLLIYAHRFQLPSPSCDGPSKIICAFARSPLSEGLMTSTHLQTYAELVVTKHLHDLGSQTIQQNDCGPHCRVWCSSCDVALVAGGLLRTR